MFSKRHRRSASRFPPVRRKIKALGLQPKDVDRHRMGRRWTRPSTMGLAVVDADLAISDRPSLIGFTSRLV